MYAVRNYAYFCGHPFLLLLYRPTEPVLGLELPHAVGVQHVVEGDPQQVLPRVA